MACGGNSRSSLGLRVTVINARATPVVGSLSAVERLPRTAAASRSVRYKPRKVSVPASGSAVVTLKAPAKLVAAMRKALRKRRSVARNPVVTLDTADRTKVIVSHKVTVKAPKKTRSRSRH
jgi:hypothetical protein